MVLEDIGLSVWEMSGIRSATTVWQHKFWDADQK